MSKALSTNLALGDGWRDRLDTRGWFDWLVTGWLFMGPVALFGGRTIADIWLSSIAAAFLVRTILRKDWGWLRESWMIAALAFWGFAVSSSVVALDANLAFRDSIVWGRFPLFAAAVSWWLLREEPTRRGFVIMTALGVTAMSIGLMLVTLHKFPISGTAWPYGGESGWASFYLTRVGAPGLVLMLGICIIARPPLALVAGMGASLVLMAAMASGKLMNLLLLLFLCGVYVLIDRQNIRRVLIAGGVATAMLGGLLASNATLRHEAETRLAGAGGMSDYAIVMETGWRVFLDNPVMGVGASNLRVACADERYADIAELGQRCRRAAHQYYLQLLAETGIVGAGLFVTMLVALFAGVWRRLRLLSATSTERLVLLALAAPAFITFFPLAAGNKIFSQWIGVFDWFALACLAAAVPRVSAVRVVSGAGSSDDGMLGAWLRKRLRRADRTAGKAT